MVENNIVRTKTISLLSDLLKETGCLNNSEYISIQIDNKNF